MGKDDIYRALEESIDEIWRKWMKVMTKGPETRECAEKYAEIGEVYVIEGMKVVLPEEKSKNNSED